MDSSVRTISTVWTAVCGQARRSTTQRFLTVVLFIGFELQALTHHTVARNCSLLKSSFDNVPKTVSISFPAVECVLKFFLVGE